MNVLRGEHVLMRLKLMATDHTYVHSYGRFLSVDMFLNPQMHLKSMLTL